MAITHEEKNYLTNLGFSLALCGCILDLNKIYELRLKGLAIYVGNAINKTTGAHLWLGRIAENSSVIEPECMPQVVSGNSLEDLINNLML